MRVLTKMRAVLRGGHVAAQDDYRERMYRALDRMRTAELQIAQATDLEDLDMGRTALKQAFAEVQHIIRSAKREQGIPLRSIGESEAIYQKIMDTIAGHQNSGLEKIYHSMGFRP